MAVTGKGGDRRRYAPPGAAVVDVAGVRSIAYRRARWWDPELDAAFGGDGRRAVFLDKRTHHKALGRAAAGRLGGSILFFVLRGCQCEWARWVA